MIISHRHEFIFIKTRKTAGTSIEIALTPHCGPKDIITPISAEDEAIRRKLGHSPRNYSFSLTDYRLRDIGRLLTKGQKKPGQKYFNHIPAQEIRQRIGETIWNRYFKFCFERNPWDMVVSQFYYYASGGTIEEFIRAGKVRSNYPLYTINDHMAVDYVGRYERLNHDLDHVCKTLDIPSLDLPLAKSGYRKDKRHYREILTRTEAEMIEERFSREIRLFGYKF